MSVEQFVKDLVYGNNGFSRIRPLFVKKDGNGKFVCGICGLRGFSARGLIMHILRRHRDVALYVYMHMDDMAVPPVNGDVDVVNNKCRVVTAKIPVELHAKLTIIAKKYSTSIASLIRHAIKILGITDEPMSYTIEFNGKTRVLSLKLSGNEIEVLNRYAKKTGLPVSEIIRRLCVYVVKTYTDIPAVRAITPIIEVIKII